MSLSWRRLAVPFLVLAGCFLASFWFVLPSRQASVYLSPDETANAIALTTFAQQGSMRLENQVLRDFPWVRPRSFVTQADVLVPVGFIGLPLILGCLATVFGSFLVGFLVPLLALSVVYPIGRLLKSWGKTTQILGAFGWLTFPTVILYANRSLFPNLPLVALMVWVIYFVWSAKTFARLLLAGFLFGLALIIRPVELFWMLPWIFVAYYYHLEAHSARSSTGLRPSFVRLAGALFLGSLLPVLVYLIVAWQTYGSPFVVGYVLRDTVIQTPQTLVSVSSQNVTTGLSSLVSRLSSLFSAWPFGFHPRDIWFNLKAYLFGIWLPWTTVSLFTALCLWSKKTARPAILVALWTLVGGLLLYGETIYQDHVGVNVVSIGNSFLRYLLPLAPILVCGFAIGVSLLAQQLSASLKKLPSTVYRLPSLLSALCLLAIITLGLSTALNGDEGLQANAQELQSYVAIRDAADRTLGPTTIILSDRSDKIFFPQFRVASPLPAREEVVKLVDASLDQVAYYSTTVSAAEERDWASQGIALVPVFTIGNQTMYLLRVSGACLSS